MAPPSPPAVAEMVDDPAVEHQPSPSPTTKPCRNTSTSGGVGVVIGTIVFLAFLARTKWIHLDADYYSFLAGTGGGSVSRRGCHFGARSSTAHLIPIPFSCDANGTSGPALCRSGASLAPEPSPPSSSPGVPPPWCPDYFRHIHTDLEPWRTAGITRDAVERAQRHAELRLVVVSGRAYVEKYRPSYQTRDVFTEWGILQLLARYPGRVPDVDMMFATGDVIRVRAADYHDDPSAAPPLFRYCKDVDKEVAILWPDWSFWGWSEVNIRPWAPLIEEVGRENARHPWRDREPYAFWKGNPGVSEARRDLFRCNNDSAAGKDWNARLFAQNWAAAVRNGFKDSSLAKQCRYRYKIYVAGRAWSVSEKYILACDSPMLALDTPYRDFFSRGLVAGKHYWPIDLADKCRAIKFAVDWGNAHPEEARRMGQEGSGFAREEMDMELVYEYMLHVLTQYAALLRYKPTVPEKAVELCPESMACPRRGRERDFMMESREKYVATCEPCTLPPPFTADEVLDKAVRDDGVRSKLLHKMDRD
ncbi:protein O-glucosyltransferase 2-like [Lolium rigidum]|uniref:protein O-glucosyltransferase 2-like n=1 Tax=Lolium rigidum TaxID=89674 RepID=UPI001F5D245D|nr:protein O-glucosyltransferase 2-like [Lolium rigidum]